jgi:hypothetical protein
MSMTTTQFFIRSLFFLTIMSSWYFGLGWLGLLLSLWYLYHYRAYELILLGLFLDIQFSVMPHLPVYTPLFLGLFLLSVWIKPKLRQRRHLML